MAGFLYDLIRLLLLFALLFGGFFIPKGWRMPHGLVGPIFTALGLAGLWMGWSDYRRGRAFDRHSRRSYWFLSRNPAWFWTTTVMTFFCAACAVILGVMTMLGPRR